MKVMKRTERADGSVNITINLKQGERAMVSGKDPALEISESSYYRLGGQVEDIVAGHVITEMSKVYWCSIEQRWVDAK